LTPFRGGNGSSVEQDAIRTATNVAAVSKAILLMSLVFHRKPSTNTSQYALAILDAGFSVE